MRQFYAPTEDVIKSAHTTLSADLSASSTTINVKNTAQFEANKYVCLSAEGDERAELRLISSVSAANKTITVSSATRFTHYKDEAIVQFDYNQRLLWKYNATTGQYAQVAGESPKDIAVDCPLGTLLEDSDGEATDKYKATYYNEETHVGTDLDDSEEVIGTGSTNLVSIELIRKSAGFKENYAIPDSRIDEARQDAQGEVWSALHMRYTFPLTRNSSFLRKIAEDLAVGLLFIDEYGLEVQNVAKDGYKRLEDARSRLDKLAKGIYTLYDEAEDEVQAQADRGTVSFYPDDSTEGEDDERIFAIGDKF
jgi:phage gp36-like protein